MGQIRKKILNFLETDPDKKYRIVVGTDSQPNNGSRIDFVTAIVVHRIGYGGIYFWQRNLHKNYYVLRQRMFTEATMSLEMAETVLALLHNDGITKFDVEIHVDIGSYGKTRDMICDIVGMIRGSGYKVKIKPDSFAASKIADKYT
ncbi:ribonuclease H-like YkuK family protein [Patescibacteria group bacterium]